MWCGGVLPSCGVGTSHHRASLLAEPGLHGAEASVAVTRELSICGRLGSRAQALSYGAGAQLLGRVWDPPRSGIGPGSPALAGRFFLTEPPGKPSSCDSKESAREAGWFSPVLFSCLAQCGPGFDWKVKVRRVGCVW